MASLNFIIDKKGDHVILYKLIFVQNKRIKISTKFQFSEKDWDRKKQYLKKSKETISDNTFYIVNNYISDERTKFNELCSRLNAINSLNYESLYRELKSNKDDSKKTLFECIELFLNPNSNVGSKLKLSSIKSYRTFNKSIQEYCSQNSISVLNWSDINLDFYMDYCSFLEHVKCNSKNTIGGKIKVLKVVMRFGYEMGYHSNLDYTKKMFKKPSEQTEDIYIKKEELDILFNFDFKNERLNALRDIFIFGCWTGLRYSDIKSLSKSNFIKKSDKLFIQKETIKTGENVIIPCNTYVLEILNRNDGFIPSIVSEQKFNKGIKQLFELAGFKELGRLKSNLSEPLYKLVSTHTMRRSFATNMYKLGVPSIAIMQITGHKTESEFIKYIKVSKDENADRVFSFFENLGI